MFALRTSTCVSLILAALAGNSLLAEEPASRTNRLSKESSPYLLLHAHNPVDWYPWGPEAFARAKREDKLIFLSIGYSSCYWCHVMEREVFSNEDIAQYMNDHFVCIKVDREERPDVDDIYMTALTVYQQLTGSNRGGGWPLSMFLTPDGNPIGGATYLPPKDSEERGPGFLAVATRLTELWTERHDDLQQTAATIARHVQRLTKPQPQLGRVEPSAQLVSLAADAVRELYDPIYGGVDFDRQQPNGPRFPNVPRLELLLTLCHSQHSEEFSGILKHSLTAMARGGIRDHLAGGFHRYSTDRRWRVPHFEKMLYDQALLLAIYAQAATEFENSEFAEVAAEIADFVAHEMTTPQGAFCSALDAETNAVEGAFYVWSAEEIRDVLGEKDAAVFSRVYGVTESSPFEHGHVLYLPKSLSTAADDMGIGMEELTSQLEPMKRKLLEHRSLRPRPLLDDKVLTAWNALMIRALAISGRELQRSQDLAAAERAAAFLLKNLRTDTGRLLRTWRNGKAKYPAYLDDYAFLTDALLELYQSTDDPKWRGAASQLSRQQTDLFYDSELSAFYYTASDHEKLIARTSTAYDGVFPAGNSVAILNLLRLQQIENTPKRQTISQAVLTRFAPVLQRSPAACCSMARAMHAFLQEDARAAEVSLQALPPKGHTWTPTRFDEKPEPPATLSEADETSLPQVSQNTDHFALKPVVPPVQAKTGQKPLRFRVYPYYNKLPRGGKCLIAVELDVAAGWHVNANPANPDFLVPTKLELKTPQKIKLTKVRYPKHHELKVEGFDTPYHVYDGKVIIYGLLEIDDSVADETAELEFVVSYQGCNEKECLPPDKATLKGKMKIAAPGEKLEKKNQAKFPRPKTEPKPSRGPSQ